MSSELAVILPRIYAALDEHRFGDLAAFYTPTVRAATPGGELIGPDELVAQAARTHAGIPALQHQVTGVLIDERATDADLRANLVAIFAGEDRVPTFELGGVWRGRAERTTDTWLISEFTITPVWQRGSRPTSAGSERGNAPSTLTVEP